MVYHKGPQEVHVREFVDYRHPDPRLGVLRVCSTRLDAFPVESSGSAGSTGVFILIQVGLLKFETLIEPERLTIPNERPL